MCSSKNKHPRRLWRKYGNFIFGVKVKFLWLIYLTDSSIVVIMTSDTEVRHQVFHNLYDIPAEGDNPKIECSSNISKSKKNNTGRQSTFRKDPEKKPS